MRKNELIHLHALLECVRVDLEKRGEREEHEEASTDRLREYESLGVTPLSVRASCGEHETAVLALARALATSVADSAAADESDEAEADEADRPEESGEPERQPA